MRKIHVLGAVRRAVITLMAEPDGRRLQNVFAHAEEYLSDDLAGVVLVIGVECRASGGTGAPAGPHGSIYPQILKYQYEKVDNTPESAFAYELCYSCHNRDQYNTDMGDQVQQKIHYQHVVSEETPCNVCHDPHGISNMQGNPINNSHLINFDISIVQSRSNGELFFQDNGYRSGQCSLMCHGADHDSRNY